MSIEKLNEELKKEFFSGLSRIYADEITEEKEGHMFNIELDPPGGSIPEYDEGKPTLMISQNDGAQENLVFFNRQTAKLIGMLLIKYADNLISADDV